VVDQNSRHDPPGRVGFETLDECARNRTLECSRAGSTQMICASAFLRNVHGSSNENYVNASLRALISDAELVGPLAF